MSQSTTDGRRLEDLWGAGATSWSTRPLPTSGPPEGETGTPPGGLVRARVRPACVSAARLFRYSS